jgi:glycine/D-amino acid oxidase-like deaminating enzyme
MTSAAVPGAATSFAGPALRSVNEYEIAVVGGGLLGSAIAWGLARLGKRVALLDEGDTAVRASRANFALVWVQSKGLGMPEYAAWTVRSSDAWAGFGAELKDMTGLDVAFERPGGFSLCLSDQEMERRAATLHRLHNQPGIIKYEARMLERAQMESMLPGLGPDVVGGSYCPLDGHVNSLRLLRTLHTALHKLGAAYLPNHQVRAITQEAGTFTLATSAAPIRCARLVLAAGNANMKLAPMVGLHAPMRPERGQIIVTERLQPFLRHPVVTLRQTDEGTVMIGDSKEEGTTPDGTNLGIAAVEAERAVRMFPALSKVNVVRTWTGVRVMTQDGFPIYEQSSTHPGAFVACCHSGVTLAANHALVLPPMIVAGELDAGVVGAFSAKRFACSEGSGGA